MHLLVTRPESDGERTAEKLRARGHEVTLAPLLSVEVLESDLGPGPWGAVVMTSANAATVMARHPRRAELTLLPVFTVGRRTAEAARTAGWRDAISADGDVFDLVRLIGAQGYGGVPILYLAGEDRAADLAGELASLGLQVRTAVVYRASKAAAFPAAVRSALAAGTIDAVLHFSQRSAEVYLDCAKAAGALDRALAPSHYCLSRQVARPLAAAGAGKIRIAPRPEEAALIDLIASS